MWSAVGRTCVRTARSILSTGYPTNYLHIEHQLCIGCTHCRSACPVDAIVGAHHLMHSVIESECTGCELCVAPCPVDCISMRPIT